MKRSGRPAAARWEGRRAQEGGTRLRNAPPVSARKGVNSQKTDKGLRQRARARRSGLVRHVWDALRLSLMAAAVLAVLGAAGWAGYRAFENNGFLALRRVDVIGNTLLAKTEILERAGLELGIKLPSVPVKRVEASLRSMPGLGEVEVRRIFPSRIEIRVKEKEPVAMGFAKGWYGLAPDGSRIAGLDWAASDLPVVDGFAGLDSTERAAIGAFLEAAKREYPGLYANFSQLALRGDDGAEIVLRDGRLKLLLKLDSHPVGGASRSASGTSRSANGTSRSANGTSRSANGPASAKTTNSAGNKSLNSLEFLQALMRQQGAALASGRTVDMRVEGYAFLR